MSQENNEQTRFSSNPFIARQQQHDIEWNQWGLDEFDSFLDKSEVINEAEQRIHKKGIIDDNEKQRIYDEVKVQYKEYLTYKEQRKEGSSVRERAYRKLDEASPETGKWIRDSYAQELWAKVLKQLQKGVSSAIFHTWLKDTEGISYQDDVLIVNVSTPFAQTQLETRFIEQIRTILSEINNAVLDIRFKSLETLEPNKEDSDDFKSTLLEIKRDLEALGSNNADSDTSVPSIENNDPPSPVIEDITQHPEYIKGVTTQGGVEKASGI